jgi:hypothetical protein
MDKIINFNQIPRPVRQKDMNDILRERDEKREELLKKMKAESEMKNDKELKILFSIFWDKVWRREPVYPNPIEIEKLKVLNLYFEKETIEHDEVIHRLNKVLHQIRPNEVGNFFLSSLSNRNLQYRAVFDAYLNVSEITPHEVKGNALCDVCGIPIKSEYDFTKTTFIRFKFGTASLFFAMDNVFILERAVQEEVPKPKPEDILIMNKIIKEIQSLPENSRAKHVKDLLKGLIKSNDDERRAFVEMLGKSRILVPKKNLEEKYRKVPTRSDWFSPVSIWQSEDGVSIEGIRDYFPEYLDKIIT